MDAIKIKEGDVVHTQGNYHGFRPTTKVVSRTTNLSYAESGVVIADTSSSSYFTVYLPFTASNGSNFEIHVVGDGGIAIETDGLKNIYHKGTTYSNYSLASGDIARLVYSSEKSMWYMMIV